MEADPVNSTTIRVTWKPPLTVKQHGQIRGYQVVYSRLENGEAHGQPVIVDVALPDAQVHTLTHAHTHTGDRCVCNMVEPMADINPYTPSSLLHTAHLGVI